METLGFLDDAKINANATRKVIYGAINVDKSVDHHRPCTFRFLKEQILYSSDFPNAKQKC